VKVYLLILLVAAAITYVSVPVVRHIALVTHTLTPVRSRDVHKVPVPRLGGVAMYVGMVAAIAVASHIPYLEGVFEGGSAWGVVTSGGLLCALGVVDDLFDLEWWAKLAGQALAASILAWQGVQLVSFPIAGLTIGSSGFSMVMTIFVVLTAINAVNFVDGLDGLAAGTVAIGAMAFFGYTYVLTRNTSPDSYASLAATLGAALIGICLGFLPHNFNPATIFMGDCGSMLLGLMSAATAIVVTGQIDPISISYGRALPAFLPVLLPLAMMLLPLTDMMLAVVRRVSAGKSPFHPDRMHIHHRLLSAGLTHRRVVLVMYMWTAAVVFPLAAWAFIDTRQAILALGLSLIAAFVFTGFMRKTKREEPAEKPAPKPVSKAVPKQDLPASVHPTKLPDKTAATPVVRVRTASTPVVDSSSPSAASSATAASPETDSSSAAASVPSSAAASAVAPSTAAPGVAAPGAAAAAPGSLSAASAAVAAASLSAASAASATTTPAPTTPARTRRSRLKPRSTTPPWLQSAEPAPSSAPSTASAASTAALDAPSSLSAPSNLSAPSTFSAPSTQSAPYFAANSPDEAIAVNPAAPLPPAAPLAAQTQMTQTPVVQTPVAQAVQQPVPAPVPEQAQPALGQPVPQSPLSTPVVPAAQAGQTQGAEPAVQTRRRRAGRHAATPVEQPLTPAAPTAMQPAAAAPSSLQSNQGATPANNNPVWQAPRNPNVRYDVVPDQSLWEDEDDDDTNPTGVPAI
jgi:UDP-N-acetylmuramyl pentapeptide phosphotransferase/UDP-N-acetylglucosamine-1-phosphate